MNDTQAALLSDLLRGKDVAALGTLHHGAPFVSMTPFAVLPDGSALVLHVSRLSSHTKDMATAPDVSLLVMADRALGVPPQALARVTVQGRAVECPPGDPRHDMARRAYLGRFPASAQTFELGDFSLFLIEPVSARVIGGFAQAGTVIGADVIRVLRGP